MDFPLFNGGRQVAGHLQQFFAATRSGLYLVSSQVWEGSPLVKRIGVRSKMGDDRTHLYLGNGTVVGVSPAGILLYRKSTQLGVRPPRPEQVPAGSHNDKTSPLVALFLNEAQAHASMEAADAMPLDARWQEQTVATLRAIGWYHPIFALARLGDQAFPAEWVVGVQ